MHRSRVLAEKCAGHIGRRWKRGPWADQLPAVARHYRALALASPHVAPLVVTAGLWHPD